MAGGLVVEAHRSHGSAAGGGCSGAKSPNGLNARDRLVLMIFATRVVQTVLRMAMGALIVYISEDFECSPATRGWLLSAHAVGYCTTQILGGSLADRFGGKGVVTLCVLASGVSLAVTPAAAASFGLQGMAATQIVMGAAMGPLFPATVRMLARWLPASERAFASTALDSGITVGSLIVVNVSSTLAVYAGWRMAFVVYGLVGMCFAQSWSRYAFERPEECPYCDENEMAFLKQALPRRASMTNLAGAEEPGFSTVLLAVFAYARLWAIYLSHFTFNYGIYFINSWSAIYYLEKFDLRPEDAALHLCLPHAANFLSTLCVSPALGRLLRRKGWSDLACRRASSGLAFLGSAACLTATPFASTAASTTACLMATLGFMALHPAGFKANYMDVTVSHGGVVSGVGNTIASVASSVGPIVVAHMREATGGWHMVFLHTACANVAAAAIFCALASSEPIEADPAGPLQQAAVVASWSKKQS